MATYIRKIEIRIRFKIKAGSYLELLTSEAMKLLGSIKSKITKNGNDQNISNLEITELAVAYGNVVNNNYQQNSKVLYTFVPSKLYGRLLDISAKYFIFLKTIESEFSYIEVWFTDQNSKPLEIKDKINITLVTN